MFKRIDHVEIVTDQLDRTVQFYTEILGFTVKARDRIERSGLGVPKRRPGAGAGDHARPGRALLAAIKRSGSGFACDPDRL
jgi:catechol 2,3-dioxygenase-like lactoylglutathione lyase family enzyme